MITTMSINTSVRTINQLYTIKKTFIHCHYHYYCTSLLLLLHLPYMPSIIIIIITVYDFGIPSTNDDSHECWLMSHPSPPPLVTRGGSYVSITKPPPPPGPPPSLERLLYSAHVPVHTPPLLRGPPLREGLPCHDDRLECLLVQLGVQGADGVQALLNLRVGVGVRQLADGELCGG